MKLLFIAMNYDEDDNKSGVMKKIKNQYQSLEYHLNDKCYITQKNENGFKIKNTELKIKIRNYKLKIFKIFEIYFFIKLIKKFINITKIDVVYIRYGVSSNLIFLNLLKKIKRRGIKIIIEFPTYPYDQEYKFELSFGYLKFVVDKIYRKFLYKYVDYAVTFSDDKKIFEIPCINISNGINLDEVFLVETKCENKNKIVLTSVSICEFWHGIDRMLYSLENYYAEKGKENIIFNIVGEGRETDKLKKIVGNSKYLKEIVKFCGFQGGKDLDEIYNETDIAVGSLGRHRSGLHNLKTLKNREYCAKGLPMLFSEEDSDFRDKPFVYKISPTEEIFDLNEMIKWWKNLKVSPLEIREYSNNFSWKIQMKKVIEKIMQDT